MTLSNTLTSAFGLLRVLFWCWMAWIVAISYGVAWQWNPTVAAVITVGLFYGIRRYVRHLRAVHAYRYTREQAAREAQWAERRAHYAQERADRADRLWEQHVDAWEREVA